MTTYTYKISNDELGPEYYPHPFTSIAQKTAYPIGLAILIIGGLMISGDMGGFAGGVSVAALSGTLAISNFISAGIENEDKGTYAFFGVCWKIIATLGALAAAGVILPTVAGWCTVSPWIAGAALVCCCSPCICYATCQEANK
jgi:hypothetical protein